VPYWRRIGFKNRIRSLARRAVQGAYSKVRYFWEAVRRWKGAEYLSEYKPSAVDDFKLATSLVGSGEDDFKLATGLVGSGEDDFKLATGLVGSAVVEVS